MSDIRLDVKDINVKRTDTGLAESLVNACHVADVSEIQLILQKLKIELDKILLQNYGEKKNG